MNDWDTRFASCAVPEETVRVVLVRVLHDLEVHVALRVLHDLACEGTAVPCLHAQSLVPLTDACVVASLPSRQWSTPPALSVALAGSVAQETNQDGALYVPIPCFAP